jgi:predicted nucleic acid-binding protein
MADRVLSHAAAWRVYDEWVENGQAIYMEEPPAVESVFRSLSQSDQAAPKDWGDSYIAAFAEASRVLLVTFDRALQRKTSSSVLLKT